MALSVSGPALDTVIPPDPAAVIARLLMPESAVIFAEYKVPFVVTMVCNCWLPVIPPRYKPVPVLAVPTPPPFRIFRLLRKPAFVDVNSVVLVAPVPRAFETPLAINVPEVGRVTLVAPVAASVVEKAPVVENAPPRATALPPIAPTTVVSDPAAAVMSPV